MSEQLEIEFKTLLTQAEYQHLLTQFTVAETDFITQTNHYFDTPTYELQALGCGLRIRQFAQNGELTLKSPQTVGLLETTDLLDETELNTLLMQKKIKQTGTVAQKIQSLGIEPQTVQPFATLTTKRAEIKLPEGLMALDQSWYSDQVDYELELEVTDEQATVASFLQLLTRLEIAYKPSQNKIQRAKQARATTPKNTTFH